ncbi:MAG TPA: GDSL-type esterase/lipase family protein [Pirellulales bacterium]|jgi:endonuclease YncB( thermonuclease family)
MIKRVHKPISSASLASRQRGAVSGEEQSDVARLGRVGGSLAIVLGAIAVLGGAAVHPAVVNRFLTDVNERREALMSSSICVALIGVGLIVVGAWAFRSKRPIAGRGVLVIISLAVVIVVDRALLVIIGVAPVVPDTQLYYRLRPNHRTFWGHGEVLATNGSGYFDREFIATKRLDELRIAMIGDSLVCGWNLSLPSTLPKTLERALDQSDVMKRPHDVMNMGVPGYSTWQEVELARESLRYKPDVMMIVFCMNDFTAGRECPSPNGGRGVVPSRSRLVGYLWNETGYGRVLIKYLYPAQDEWSVGQLARQRDREELLSVNVSAALRAKLDDCLSQLQEIYRLAKSAGVRPVLVVAPMRFQIYESATRTVQNILLEHARGNDVDVVDLAPAFTELLKARMRHVMASTKPSAESLLGRYFMDDCHFSSEGNRVIADQLLRHLESQHVVATLPGSHPDFTLEHRTEVDGRNFVLDHVITADRISVRPAEGGGALTVRLLCVRTAQSESEPYFSESMELTTTVLKGRTLRLQYDPTMSAADGEGNLFCYVFAENSMLNMKLIRFGWSRYLTKYGNGIHGSELTAAEHAASEQKVGIWKRR